MRSEKGKVKMRKIVLTLVIITATIVAIMLTLRFTHPEWKANLVSPGFPLGASQKAEPVPSSTPNISAPKSFTFDGSTDLKAELEKVNPQVLDSDFE